MWLRRAPAPIKQYYWNSRPNFGDAMAPLLLERFAGIKTEFATVQHAEVITVGSILEYIPPRWDGYVLGAGKLYPDSKLYLYGAETKVLAVRGPLSKRFLGGDCALGDPGLLADELLPVQTRTFDLGIVPHWSDKNLATDKRFHSDKWTTTVIDPTGDPLAAIAMIGQCKKIVSSSLHGLIVADAFGIPRRFELTSQFNQEGGIFKFQDYSASIGLELKTGETQVAYAHNVETRKHELWDAYRELGSVLRSR